MKHPFLKYSKLTALYLLFTSMLCAQNTNLNYFITKASDNALSLKENNNLLKIGELQNKLITAQNNSFKVDVTSEVLFAPFFDSNGNAIEITTNPSANAYGYDVGITNGGLYSAQVNVTKTLFNNAITQNLIFQNKLQNDAISLSNDEILHNIKKNVTDNYINAYQLQQQIAFIKTIKEDLSKRLEIAAVLVKHGIIAQSDYALLQLNVENKNLELEQTQVYYNTSIAQLYSLCNLPMKSVESLENPMLQKKVKTTSFYYEKKFKNDSLQITANQKVFENQYQPQVTVYGNSGLNAVQASNIPHNFGMSAGIKLVIPLYDGHQKKINSMQNAFKQENLLYAKETNKIQKENALKSIQNQIDSLEKSILLIQKQIDKQNTLLEIFKGKMVNGELSVIDYLTLVQNYKTTIYTKLQMQTNLSMLYNQYNFTNW